MTELEMGILEEEEQKKVRERLNLPDPDGNYKEKEIIVEYLVKCPYCSSDKIVCVDGNFNEFEKDGKTYFVTDDYYVCNNCGLMFTVSLRQI